MIRRNYPNLSDAERAAALPNPRAQLVSMGEFTRLDTEFTNTGQRQVAVTFEVFIEWMAGGGGNRTWHRYKDRPDELVAQFDTTPAPPPAPADEYTPEEIAAFKSTLRPKDPPIPELPPQPLTVRPNW